VTPPATPVITSIVGAEKSVIISWRANSEKDLAEYRMWRSTSADELRDVRRLETAIIISPDGETVIQGHTDQRLAGPANYYYRLAAVDTNGLVSEASTTRAARVAETAPPEKPEWTSAERSADETSASLSWNCSEAVDVTVERQTAGTSYWIVVAATVKSNGRDAADEKYVFEFNDPKLSPTGSYGYRLTARAANGLTSQSAITEVRSS
jgi:hypothetical protein